MLRALDHAVIAVRDLDAATRCYTSLLGRHPSWRGEHPGFGSSNTLFALRNTYIELLCPTGEGPIGKALRERLEGDGEGLFALAFATNDAARLTPALRARGLDASEPSAGEGVDASTGAVRRWRNVMLRAADTRGVVLFGIEHLPPEQTLARGEAIGGEEDIVEALDHVVITTVDPERSRSLYGEGLGLRLALDRSFPDRGVRLLFFRIGGITVEIAARLGAQPPDAPDRLWGLAYRVPNVEAGRERLARAGFDVSAVRPGQKPGTRVCTVRAETHGVATLLIGPD